MCFAYGTSVQLPDGSRAIERLEIGDPVLAASARDGGWAWQLETVRFSEGAGPGGAGMRQTMVSLGFGEGARLIVTPDQPMLLASGLLRRADRLTPGRDRLVASGGDAIDLLEVSLSLFGGGIHSIATSFDPARSLDRHLLACAGVICGDYALQLRGDDPAIFAPDPGPASLPGEE